MQFNSDKSLTMDDSAFIEVYSGEEYIFSFPCNKKELANLKKVIEECLLKIRDEEDMRQVQKTPEFWREIRKNRGVCDTQKLLREYRAKKSKNLKK